MLTKKKKNSQLVTKTVSNYLQFKEQFKYFITIQ